MILYLINLQSLRKKNQNNRNHIQRMLEAEYRNVKEMCPKSVALSLMLKRDELDFDEEL